MKNFISNLKKSKNRIAKNAISILIVLIPILFCVVFIGNNKKLTFAVVELAEPEIKDHIYLSDLEYITENNWSFNGWDGHYLQKDRNPEGGTIRLLIDGEKIPFSKGLGIHAEGQMTFDISEYSINYPRFVAKIGLDASRTEYSSIKFIISVSDDGIAWESLLTTDTILPKQEAIDVNLDVTGKKYLRIFVDDVDNNNSDHGVLGYASLAKESYNLETEPYTGLHPLSYYDNILKTQTVEYNYENNYRLVLERELVRKLDYRSIQDAIITDSSKAPTIDWILSDNKVLEQVIEVGEINDTRVFLDVLSKLYNKYKNEFNTDNGFLYQKMMIALATSYSTDLILSPLSFNNYTRTYDPVEKFDLYKQLYDTNKLNRPDWFQNYHIELLRMVMQDGVKNDELLWLNNFIKQYKNGSLDPYNYMVYRFGPHYDQPEYFDINNKDKYDQKYHLAEYNVPFAVNRTQRYWMVFEFGGICWNISRVGTSLNRTVGYPSTGLYQPGHEVYYEYRQDSQGRGVWNLGNDVFGWGKSSTTWYGGNRYRLLFNWGAKYFSDEIINNSNVGTSSGYMYLGQANLNNLEAYRKSYYYNLIANSYEEAEAKLNIYNKSLDVNNINLDSYDYKISLYKSLGKTSTEWKNLAEDIIEAYTYYPNAMADMIRVIRPYLSTIDYLDIQIKERNALERASRATNNEIWQDVACRQLANALLGKEPTTEVAKFSFDGTNAGKIMMNGSYAERNFGWSYTLDGGLTFSEVTTEHQHQLTPAEIATITDTNDIGIAIAGLGDANADYIIPINKGVLSSNLYANDLENRVIGVNLKYEWRNSETDEWTSYAVASPNNTGNKTLYVRLGATGNNVPSDSARYTFTEDNQPDTRKYVPVSHISIASVSSEATGGGQYGHAINAIDGNYNTRWHSAWDGSDNRKYIILKLDSPIILSAIEYVAADGGNGFINKAHFEGSMDGENFEDLGTVWSWWNDSIWGNRPGVRKMEFTEKKEVKYIKITGIETSSAYGGSFMAARMFNIFQDLTNRPHPIAEVAYSPSSPTNGNVTARIINMTEGARIVNNNGSDTYEFTDNGNFDFEIEGMYGKRSTITASVTWIDRVAPVATINYSTTNKTNKSVIATLTSDEDIIVTNLESYKVDAEGNVYDHDDNLLPDFTVDQEGNIKDANGNIITNINVHTYEFYDNGSFTFEFTDLAGNKATKTATVSWIDHSLPSSTISYSTTSLTNKNVTATIKFDKDCTITNNNGSSTYTFTENGSFTFEYIDAAGNTGTETATVSWIDKVAPTAKLKYDKQKDKVIVTVVDPSEEITFSNKSGIYTYIYNGNYEIAFTDKAGNVGKLTAIIDTLKNRPTPTPDKPDDNKPTNPDDNKPDNNKPDDNKPDNNKPTNQDKPNNTEKPDTSIINDYEQFILGNISLNLPKSAVKKGMKLNVELFILGNEITTEFGKESEYYDISMMINNQKEKLKTTEPMKITIKRTSMKELIGVFEITEDNNVKLIDYSINGDNIEITTTETGKYVISYKEVKAISPKVTIPIIATNKTDNNLVWFIASAGAIILGTGVYFAKIKKK